MPDVSYPVGDGSGQGYLAVPAAETTAPQGAWPGVVVIHEALS